MRALFGVLEPSFRSFPSDSWSFAGEALFHRCPSENLFISISQSFWTCKVGCSLQSIKYRRHFESSNPQWHVWISPEEWLCMTNLRGDNIPSHWEHVMHFAYGSVYLSISSVPTQPPKHSWYTSKLSTLKMRLGLRGTSLAVNTPIKRKASVLEIKLADEADHGKTPANLNSSSCWGEQRGQ